MGIQAQTRPVSLSDNHGTATELQPAQSYGPPILTDVSRSDHSHPSFIGTVLYIATSNVTPSGPQTIDGDPVDDQQVVFLAGQTDPDEWGPWKTNDAGAWTQFSATPSVVYVLNGAEHAASLWITEASGTPNAIKFWQLNSPLFTPYADIGNVTGAITVEARDGAVQRLVLTGNITVTLDAAVAPDKAQALTLFLVQDGTGSRTVTWPASVRWDSGTAPTLSTGANDVDVIQLLSYDGGTTWYGFEGGLDFAVPA